MNEVDEAEIEEAVNCDLLPSGFVDEFLAAQGYNERVDEGVITVAFDEGNDDSLTPVPDAPVPEAVVTSSQKVDPSKLVPHRQQQLLQSSDFETALIFSALTVSNMQPFAKSCHSYLTLVPEACNLTLRTYQTSCRH
jgi:hypothetical protein